jgi:glycosyltransferase involved in cell wall biosynthesis
VNSEIIHNGCNGYLPANEEEWVNYISMLIQDENLRNKIGAAGRKTVEEKFSVDAWKEAYLNYFDQLTNKSS